ncbi:MAG: T9SS type A sorting domain-containing protein [Bacteroidota bacterium]
MKTIKFAFVAFAFAIMGKVTAQNITTIAGTGTFAFSGDGGAATSAALSGPQDVALDTFGNIYIADAAVHRIRKITAATGVITTLAGTGSSGYSGDGGAASAATFYSPIGLAVDYSGNVYVADVGNHCIRKITAATGVITTVAGSGVAGYSGDGGAATSARLYAPYDVTVDASGNLYIADVSNNCIRKVTASTGFISTVAGTTLPGFTGDGGIATAAKLYQPFSVAVDASNNLYITDASNNRIRKVTASTGIITTIAGTGVVGASGDGGAATSAQFNKPYSISLDNSGNIYVSDFNNHKIRKITVSSGVITSIAGTGSFGFSGDGGLAVLAQLANPKGVFVDKANNVFIADELNNRVRFICNAVTIPSAPIVSSPITLCIGSSPVPLTAIGSSLKWYTTATGGTGSSTAPTPSVSAIGSTTYYVTQSSACGESPRAAIVVNVVASPSAPSTSGSIVYCQGAAATALSATGSPLLWYTSATGGTGSAAAPTPVTSSTGTTTYYVRQGIAGCESSRVPITVLVNPTPSAPVVSDLRYCLLAPTVALTAAGTNLKWYSSASGGSGSSTAPTPSTAVDGSVMYYVSQTNIFACESPRATLMVSTHTKPKVSITAATAPKFFVCKGSKLTLKTIVAPYGLDYQWQLGTLDIIGATADSFDAVNAGSYRVIVSNAPNCNDTAAVLVDIDSSFTTTSINPTDINICDGVSIKLYSTSSLGAGYSYQWIKDGILLNDTSYSIVVKDKGVYQLKVTNSLGCAVTSNSSVVNVFSPVSAPIISQLGSTLSVPVTYALYQWYRNGKAIAGATMPSYTISFDGDYSVEVGDVNGCKNESAILAIQGLNINESLQNEISVYPNPSEDYVFVNSSLPLRLTLSNVLGRAVIHQQEQNKIDISSLPTGIYILYIRDQSDKLLKVERITKTSGE